jgi:hypothetical protein
VVFFGARTVANVHGCIFFTSNVNKEKEEQGEHFHYSEMVLLEMVN